MIARALLDKLRVWFTYWPLMWDLAGAKITGTRQERRAILRAVLNDLWKQYREE